MITLYNVVSSDGYIADKNGSEDFIPDSYWPHTLNTLKQYDVILLGRKTYETIQKYDKESVDSFESLPVRKVVVTENKEFKVKDGYELFHNVEDVIKNNLNIVVTSGPKMNNYLIQKGLVDKITYHKVPEPVVGGLKPYDNVGNIETKELFIAGKLS